MYPPTFAVGDSVLVGGTPALVARMGSALSVDAAVGRQLDEADQVLRQAAAQGRLGTVVIVHLGTNGSFTAGQIDRLFSDVGPRRTVLLVNVFVPRRWEGEVNGTLAAAAGRHPNAVLVDWHAAASTTPGLVVEDGFHLTPPGALRYADLIVSHIPRG